MSCHDFARIIPQNTDCQLVLFFSGDDSRKLNDLKCDSRRQSDRFRNSTGQAQSTSRNILDVVR
jgi:hypothetical protein